MRNAEDLVQDYRRQQRNRKRDRLFTEYVSKWYASITIYITYILCISVMYFSSPKHNCNIKASSFIFAEIIIKISFATVRTTILMLGKWYLNWILFYKYIRPIMMGVLLIWNLLMVFIAAISFRGCKANESVTFVIMVIVITYDFSFFVWTWVYFMYWLWDKIIPEPNRVEIVPITDRQENINKVIEELKKLKAKQSNYNPNEDLCCICMNVMEEINIVNLPWHPRHCMHFSCISEWFQTNLNCPMWKEAITLESIQNKLENDDEGDVLHVNTYIPNNCQSPDSTERVNHQIENSSIPVRIRTVEENKHSMTIGTLERNNTIAEII